MMLTSVNVNIDKEIDSGFKVKNNTTDSSKDFFAGYVRVHFELSKVASHSK